MGYSDLGTTGGGIEIDYFQDAVLQATCGTFQIFDNIRFRGYCVGGIAIPSIQGISHRGYLNIDDLILPGGSLVGALVQKGFYKTPYATYTPTLTYGGSSTGMLFTKQIGEYYVIGNMVFVHVSVAVHWSGRLERFRRRTGYCLVALHRQRLQRLNARDGSGNRCRRNGRTREPYHRIHSG